MTQLSLTQVRDVLARIDCPFPEPWTFVAWTVADNTLDSGYRVVIRGFYELENAIRPGETWTVVTRDWLVHPESDAASVVRTAWAAVRASVEHEASEYFRFDGVTVMKPHEFGNGDAKP